MFEFLKSKKRKEKERLEKQARIKILPAAPRRIENNNQAATYDSSVTDYVASMDAMSTWLLMEAAQKYAAEETSNQLSEGSGSFSGAGASSSYDDDSSSRSSSYSSSYSSSSCGSSSYDSDSSSSSSDSSSSCSSD